MICLQRNDTINDEDDLDEDALLYGSEDEFADTLFSSSAEQNSLVKQEEDEMQEENNHEETQKGSYTMLVFFYLCSLLLLNYNDFIFSFDYISSSPLD